ncbi:MAG: prepilin-type N-terminal cleavage/methylation domain-containing protein [Verrucomicrobiota bacterium]
MTSSIQSNRLKNKGFTLIEIITVITIIAILAALILATVSYANNAAARKKTQVFLVAIGQGLDRYKEEYGEFPRVIGGSDNPVTQGRAIYQAVSGDGSDSLDLGGGGGVPSDGRPGTEGPFFLPSAYSGAKQTAGIVDPDQYFLKDAYGNPYRYMRAEEGVKTQNPDYDLWSIGNADGDNSDEEKWITNW